MKPVGSPDWNRLYEQASLQGGLFTTQQAADAGYSPQLLNHHVHAGRLIRQRRGLYRLVHFPSGDAEDLIEVWLQTERAGVFSHHTALALHGLSDVMPSQRHLTLPLSWSHRRFRVPPDVVLHHADVAPRDRTWFGVVPLTGVRRTLNDCAAVGLAPDLLNQAASESLRRGLVAPRELRSLERALKPFGGLSR